MNTRMTRIVLAAALAVSALAFSTGALAEEVKMVGTITEIQIADDGNSAVATLTDGKTGKSVSIRIDDQLTLDKFKDERIVEGDEIRVKYDDAGGSNHSLSFKKTAGC